MASPIIVEDGTGVAGANSYVSEAEARRYAELRNKPTLFDDDDALIAGLLTAMDYLQTITDFQGVSSYIDQALLWPRNGVYIDSLEFDEFSIPAQLKQAQIVLAMAVVSGINIMPMSANAELSVKKEKVGPLEVEYFEAAKFGVLTLTQVDALLYILRGGFTGLRTVRY